jgi:hypothetical protein
LQKLGNLVNTCEIASGLAKAGEFEKALETARIISNVYNRSTTLERIASGLANAGKPCKHIFEEAVEDGVEGHED